LTEGWALVYQPAHIKGGHGCPILGRSVS
jgi:hypothetical protein